MAKQIVKLDFNDKIIGSKPLLQNDNLISIRNKIKEKINSPYIFLDQDGNIISKEDENDYTLQDIIVGKIIKLKSDESPQNSIKVFLNENLASSLNCSKETKINEIRKILFNKIKDDFVFLDSDGNKIELGDEQDYSLEDILNQDYIKLMSTKEDNSKISKELPPATPLGISEKNIKKKEDKEAKEKPEKKIIDFSKYEIIQKRDDLTTYKYSNEPKKEAHELVYQYYYDDVDLSKEAYVVLFCGKTGDGKSTAINAFFNIVKGIKIEDNYRFILITEPTKKTGQAESQTDGVHLYYINDYENNPIIIIDSQGYGDTRGKQYDEKVNDAFRYVFSSLIDHINTVCFISKANTNRLDILTRYIFSSVTSLFSEDITENFIILATFANKDTMNNGPAFVESIQTDADFLKINKRKHDDNWWYSFDSKCILDNETDKLTKYSFEKMNELYEKKIKILMPKSIKKCAEVLETRNELKIQVQKLKITFEDLMLKQDNLNKEKECLKDNENEIISLKNQIDSFENQIKNLSPKEQELELEKLNNDLEMKISKLDNKTFIERELKLVSYDSKVTHCDYCKRNCHYPCGCWFSSLGRCRKFSLIKKICENCGCHKERHGQNNYKYEYQDVSKKANTDKEKDEERKKADEQKSKINKQKEEKLNEMNNVERQKEKLNEKKNGLEKKKNDINNKIGEIAQKIRDNKLKIFMIIQKLQAFSEKINTIAMNNNHTKTEEEYVDSLKDNINAIGVKEEEQKKYLDEIKKNNKLLKGTLSLKNEDLLSLSDTDLSQKFKTIMSN